MKNEYTRAIGCAVAAQSLAIMTTELVITRIFSVVVWYHFAFFAISVALFGTGAGAIFVHVKQRSLVTDRAPALLCLSSAAFALTVVVVDFLLVRVVPLWFGESFTQNFATMTGRILGLFAIATAPFFVGGFTVSLAVARHARDVHRLYSADLIGAGLGCLVAVPLLGEFGGPGALLAAAALGGGASFLFARSDAALVSRRVAIGAPLSVAIAVLLGVVASSAGQLNVRIAKQLDLRRFPPEFDGWNSFSQVTVLPVSNFSGWGRSPTYHGPTAPQKSLYIDLGAMTTLTRFDGSFGSVEYALHDLSAFVFHARPDPGEVCIIGAGGGKDVLAALAAGSRRVTAVEINSLIVDGVVRGKFRDFTGDLYSRPDVDVHVEDGRSFVRRTDRHFDVLQLSMVDTSAATAAGAFALTENSLYTTDAFADFLSKLTADGILSVSTVSVPGLAVGARLAGMARAALERRGSSPARSVAVIQTPWLGGQAIMHDVLVKPSGFTPEEVARIARASHDLGFAIGFLPGLPAPAPGLENGWIYHVLETQSSAALARDMATWPVDASAIGDERPFFFYQDRLSNFIPALFAAGTELPFGNGLVILAKVLAVALAFVAAFLLLPLAGSWRDLLGGEGSAAVDLAYVSCLGVGFMFIEIGLVQRFTLYLGHPTYTLAVVLLVILIGGGLGSRSLSSVTNETRARRVVLALGGIVFYSIAVRLVAPHLFDATLHWPIAARAVVVAALLGPLGFLLGVPYPAGMGAVARRAPSRVPWLWAMNSATGVLGSVVATMTSLHAGIDACLEAGAAFYLCSLLVAARVATPRRAP